MRNVVEGSEHYYKKYLGKEVLVTVKGISVKCFVAGIDPSKGISMKPIDPDDFENISRKVWALTKDGNAICLNMSFKEHCGVNTKRLFNYFVGRIAAGKFNHDTFESSKWLPKQNGARVSGGEAPPCVFK